MNAANAMNAESSINHRAIDADKKGMSRKQRRSLRELSKREAGFVMLVTAIMMPLFLMCVALVVDVGMYYFKAIQVQRAADSAALAGVTQMPSADKAIKVAIEMAKRNGYADATGDRGTLVNASVLTNSTTRLRVTITDKSTTLFFGSSLLKNWTISKTSVAEYVSNIPLGSKENYIGTGDLSGAANPPGQGFWLSVAGPCQPKEGGDQFSSRYDGNGVKQYRYPDAQDALNVAMICDYDKSAAAVTSGQNYQQSGESAEDYFQRLADQLGARQTERNNANAEHFPAVSINQERTADGYNYIVSVPCTNTATPAPCPTTDGFPTNKTLVIQAFDPVFNPVTVGEFLDKTYQPANGRYSRELKRDRTGIPATNSAAELLQAKCTALDQSACNPDFGSGNPTPATVRVSTRFTVYVPDDTPAVYSDDTTTTQWPSGILYRSCLYKYGNVPLDAATGEANDPKCTGATPVPAPLTPEPIQAAANNWVNIAEFQGGLRGKYRVNVHTETAQDSFGGNSFALRAFFVDTAQLPQTTAPMVAGIYKTCAVLAQPIYCASVAGDSHMSVFATAAAGTSPEFYLAQLSPASAYRGKSVVVRLWDAGEGGDTIQVLRPKEESAPGVPETCAFASDPQNTPYCTAAIKWTLGYQRISDYLDPVQALNYGVRKQYVDPCIGNGGVTSSNQYTLNISGNANSVEGCPAGNVFPTNFVNGRYGPYADPGGDYPKGLGKFNDRLVNIVIKVPERYGCTPAPVTDTCIEAPLPEAGWWKIKYNQVAGAVWPLTDRSTWTVELLGDPVHLVEDQAT
jgi:Flp pilus assembly protein TadG